MAKRLTARQKQQRASQRKQERLTAQYHRLLTQTKNVFHDANVGKYGVSFEKFVKSLGTSTGLKRPTEKSIKALKKAQSQEQVLKLARREVLMKRYSTQQREQLQELSERIKEQETLNDKVKGFDKVLTEALKGCQRNIKNFIIQLDNLIARFGRGTKPNVTGRQYQVLTNAQKLKRKLLNLYESYVKEIRRAQSDDDESAIVYYLEKLITVSDNCEQWCNEHDNIEPSLLYRDYYDAFESMIIPNEADFV